MRPLALIFVLCLSRAALGQESPPGQSGIFIGARAGYGIPAGKVGVIDSSGESTDLSEGFSGMVPFVLELGYRVLPQLSIGATLQYGFAFLKHEENCGNCSGHDIVVGANVYLHPAPGPRFAPWVGAGIGYESLGFKGTESNGGASFTGLDVDASFSGIQFLNLQVGGDFAASPLISVGPFLGVSLGKYDSVSATATQGGLSRTESADITNTAVHEWFTIGLRCRFNL